MTRNDDTPPTHDDDTRIHDAFNHLHLLLQLRNHNPQRTCLCKVTSEVDNLHHDFTDATMDLKELTD